MTSQTLRLVLFSLLSFWITRNLRAAGSHIEDSFEVGFGKIRYDAPGTVDPRIVSFIEENIPPARTKDSAFLKEGEFSQALVNGLQPFLPGSNSTPEQKNQGEALEARVMANLIGMVESDGKPNSGDQWDKLGTSLKKALAETNSPAYSEFLKRMLWTKLFVEKVPSNKPEAQAFNEEIKLALEKKKQQNEELDRLAESAVGGNDADRKLYRSKLEPSTALAVIAARANSKDAAASKKGETEIKALWYPGSKDKEISFSGANVVQFDPADPIKAFKSSANEFAARGWRFTPELENDGYTGWVVNGSNGFKLTKLSGSAPEGKLATNDKTKPPSPTTPTAGLSDGDKKILMNMLTTCNASGCHAGAVSWSGGTFVKANRPLKPKDLLATGPQEMRDALSALSSDQLAALKNFANQPTKLADVSLH